MSREVPDSSTVFVDKEFESNNAEAADNWVRIGQLYPQGQSQPTLLPDKMSRDQFEQGDHFECFMLTALATLVHYPESIRNCFISTKPRQDGRYTFQFYRYNQWVTVEIDDRIPLVDGDTVYIRSPTKHWWPLLIEKAFAKFYRSYTHIEGCTLQEALHDLTGHPVLNVPLDVKLASAVGANIMDGNYWLEQSKNIRTGKVGMTSLSKKELPSQFGMRDEQTYSIQEIVSMNGGTEMVNLLAHLYSPFEEDTYIGPMSSDDSLWTPELRAKLDPSRKNSIFLPMLEFIRIFSSVQMCYMKLIEATQSMTFEAEWEAGTTAGGNPTLTSWRKNPMFLVRNQSSEALSVVAEIRQLDQREDSDPESDSIKYIQCGLVLSQASFPNPVPTRFVTGNNHKSIHKGLFLNSREVANVVTIPPNSLCYLVPTAMQRQAGKYALGIYKMKGATYDKLQIEPVNVGHLAWEQPAVDEVELQPKSKDRVDFYVDEPTEVHILLSQLKPFTLKSGGDNMTEDFCGMYLYDDGDKKIGGVNAATNFREISLIHRLPRSGRYALSVTCPKGSGAIPTSIMIVGSGPSNVRIVDPPADAKEFGDSDEDDDDEDQSELIDYEPRTYPKVAPYNEPPDSNLPYEDRQFYMDNRSVTEQPWLHITELYPEGKTQPLVPDVLSLEHFEQGDHFECFMLVALGALTTRHPDVIKNCFLTKKVRQDGRYAFQFFRYGQWHVVEIDDRIPVVEGTQTLYISSPTKHWWPLLLEKAFAKFYSRYSNIEGCTLQEALQDLTGNPVANISTDEKLAKAAGYDIHDPFFWEDLDDQITRKSIVCTALTKKEKAEPLGMRDEQTYAIMSICPIDRDSAASLDNTLVQLYCPFVEDNYTGPLSSNDSQWTPELLKKFDPKTKSRIFMPASTFIDIFTSVQVCYIGGVVNPCNSFHSKWDKGCSGGNPIFTTWRDNPRYVVENKSAEPLQLIFTIRQPDQRSTTHTRSGEGGDGQPRYIQCGMVLTQSNYKNPIPTHLVTLNNHRSVHKGLFLNSREVSNLVTVPPNSLSYLIPSPMQRDQTARFMLSYYLMNSGDAKLLSIRRQKPSVAVEKPAVDELELIPRSKDRVDFLVDCPSEVHILMRQLKPFAMKNGGDCMTEDYCGMYLYNDKDQRINGVAAATNYRETSLVHTVPKAGRYAMSVTCVKGAGKIPISVTIVAVSAAKVRITDPPDDAEEFFEVDLSFLDPEPEGIPLEELPLYEDKTFLEMLEKLKSLHKQNKPQANQAAIAALEKQMNARAHELAKIIIAKERPKFLTVPGGFDMASFTPLLNDDKPFVDKEVERFALKRDPRNAGKVKEAEKRLNERAAEIANEYQNPDRSFVDPEIRGVPIADVVPLKTDEELKRRDKRLRDARRNGAPESDIHKFEDEVRERIIEVVDAFITANRDFLGEAVDGVPTALLPLDSDAAFKGLEVERYRLLKDPKKNGAAIRDAEAKLMQRAKDLAGIYLLGERGKVLRPDYRGIPWQSLPLDNDAGFRDAERRRAALFKSGSPPNATQRREVEEAMHARAEAVAAKENEKDRATFMDPAPMGLPLAQIPLNDDAAFLAAEARRARLKQDPAKRGEVKACEDEMNARARELAQGMLSNDRGYLDPAPLGIPVDTLPLDADAKFKALESERFKLKADPKNAGKVKDKEKELNARAFELAKQIKDKGLEGLEKRHLGIPLEDLPISTDPEMKRLEEERRAAALAENPDKGLLKEIDDEMNARAKQLAQTMHDEERAASLGSEIEGVPREDVPLDDNAAFIETENQIRRLNADPKKNAAKIKELQGELKRVASGIARSAIQRGRSFLNPQPHGVPITSVPLDQDSAFLKLEAALRKARKSSGEDSPAVRDLKDKMNDRAAELALNMLKSDRAYLMREPEGVPLDHIDYENDDHFTRLEQDRTAAKNNAKSPSKAAVQDAEAKINDRLKALALALLDDERRAYNQAPLGVPIKLLPIHQDKPFRQLENERRAAERDGKPTASHEDKIAARLDQIARETLRAERPSFLARDYEGVAVKDLPIDQDAAFTDLEAQRYAAAARKDANGVKAAEESLHARARELAKEKLVAQRSFLPNEFRSVTLDELPLDTDKVFGDVIRDRNRASEAGAKPKVSDLEKKAIQRCNEMANELLEKERPKYIDMDELQGYTLPELKLDSRKPFLELEEARWRAIRERGGNRKHPEVAAIVEKIMDLLREAVEDLRRGDRDFLSPEPDGVPLEFIPYEADKTFNDLEKQRRQLRAAGAADKKQSKPEKVADIEERMRDRNRELARQVIAGDRGFLDPEPNGIPLQELPLNADKTFRDQERRRQQLKRDPDANRDDIESIESLLNDRAREMAMELFEKDRAFLDPEPESVPLTQLSLNTDKPFRDLEIQRRRCRKDPGKAARVKELEDKMNHRCHEMAKAWLSGDRAYLDSEPEGVLLEYLNLNNDQPFRDLERQRMQLKREPGRNGPAIKGLEDELNERARTLARELKAKERPQYLKNEYLGVPSDYLPIDQDRDFAELEKKRRAAKRSKASDPNVLRVLDSDLNSRATDLAQDFLDEERAFLDPEPEGIPLADLGLNSDKPFRDMELERRRLRRDPKRFAEKIQELEERLNERAHEIARKMIADDRSYLNPEPHGVPLEYLPIDTDPTFHDMERQRRALKREPSPNYPAIKELEDRLNDRAHELAREYLDHERDYLDPEPEGVPIANVPIDNDTAFRMMEGERRKLRRDPSKNQRKVKDLEDRLNERARQLARDARGFVDHDFHSANSQVAPKWVRVSDMYPEGVRDHVLPERPSGADVESGPDGSGVLAPYLAAMTRNLPLFHRLVETKVPQKGVPFTFCFHGHSGPSRVHIDDRIPVGSDGHPMFTRAPNRHWYPMLIEKAYAKFRGGYKNLDYATPHEVLRDLTGRPVTHIPLEPKLAKASNIDPRHPRYWRSLRDDIARGDVVTAMSLWDAPDGVHRQSSYAIMAVVDTIEGSDDPNDTLIRLHNSYRYAPYYNGPMHKDDPHWTSELLALCKYDRSRPDSIFMPIPVFIRNFVSLQKANANSGDPITHSGEWDAKSSGGNPNTTSFRNNPIYLVENRGSRSANVIVELRHQSGKGNNGSLEAGGVADDGDDSVSPVGGRSPSAATSDTYEPDAGSPTFPQTGFLVLMASTPITIPTQLIAHNAFRPWHKSIVLDSRDVCVSFDVPPTTTCFVVPYTMRRGVYGRFTISLFPFKGKFGFQPLAPSVVMSKPLIAETNVISEVDGRGRRLDFLMDEASEIHILAQQTLPYDSGKKGNLHASNDVQLSLFDENDRKIASTGDPTDYREQVALTRTVQPARYAILLLSPQGTPKEFPITVYVYASKKANLRWIPTPAGARPLVQTRFPALPKSAPVTTGDHGNDGDDVDGRRGSLPPISRTDPLEMINAKVPKQKVFVEVPVGPEKPKPPPKKVFAFGSSSPRVFGYNNNAGPVVQ